MYTGASFLKTSAIAVSKNRSLEGQAAAPVIKTDVECAKHTAKLDSCSSGRSLCQEPISIRI